MGSSRRPSLYNTATGQERIKFNLETPPEQASYIIEYLNDWQDFIHFFSGSYRIEDMMIDHDWDSSIDRIVTKIEEFPEKVDRRTPVMVIRRLSSKSDLPARELVLVTRSADILLWESEYERGQDRVWRSTCSTIKQLDKAGLAKVIADEPYRIGCSIIDNIDRLIDEAISSRETAVENMKKRREYREKARSHIDFNVF